MTHAAAPRVLLGDAIDRVESAAGHAADVLGSAAGAVEVLGHRTTHAPKAVRMAIKPVAAHRAEATKEVAKGAAQTAVHGVDATKSAAATAAKAAAGAGAVVVARRHPVRKLLVLGTVVGMIALVVVALRRARATSEHVGGAGIDSGASPTGTTPVGVERTTPDAGQVDLTASSNGDTAADRVPLDGASHGESIVDLGTPADS